VATRRELVENAKSECWREARAKSGNDPATTNALFKGAVIETLIGWVCELRNRSEIEFYEDVLKELK
jgi:hypothetical protein